MDPGFLKRAAFVCVDLQEGQRGEAVSDDKLPAAWKDMGFTADDVNAASDFAWAVCLPNAVRVAEACRHAGLPMIFIHWGHRFEDGMDLDPEVRRTMLGEHGTNYSKWGGLVGSEGARPADALQVRKGEYVLAKTAQDAFASCNIEFVLRNLEVDRVIFVGGHTEACLGKTARSAKRLGFLTLCVEDATNNARESTRLKGIRESGFDVVVSTDEFVRAVEEYAGNERRID